MLDRLWWAQEAVKSNEIKEVTQEQMSDFLDSMSKSKETIKKCKYEENMDRKKEEQELSLYEDFFDWNEDIENFESRLQELQQQEKTPEPNQYENQKETETLSEKEKIIKYAQISELAYWKYETTDNWEVQLTGINLDPLSFPNLKNLTNSSPENLTPDEKTLYAFIKENKDNYNLDHKVDNNISNILKLAWYNSNTNNIANLWDNIPDWITENLREQQLIVAWLLSIKEEKQTESQEWLDKLKQNYDIIDYYPKWQDRNESWFQAVALEYKDKVNSGGREGVLGYWNKHISICWSQLTEIWDIWEDMVMLVWHIPIRQTIDLIKFIERNTKDLWKWEKIKIMWHSLGWALSQIATAMYSWQVEETYTFNSPGAKELEAYVEAIKEELAKNTGLTDNDKELIIAKFKEFWYNEDSNKIVYDKENSPGSELITNVAWIKWLSPTANLWEDIWDYSIELKELFRHWIAYLIEYVDRLREDSEELKKKYIEREKIKIDKDIEEK